jgi:methanogenic corrinoid protein MtbC1
LLSGSTRKCWAAIRDAIPSDVELKDFSLNVLQPALYEIGHRWETGQISIAHEHLASAVAGRIQSLVYERLAPTRERLGSALVTAPPNEYHELGPRMVADFLELDGWVTHYFGANTPAEDLLRFVRAYPIYLVMISVTMPFNLVMCRHLVDAIRTEGSSRSVKIMVGGQAFTTAATPFDSIDADGYAPNAKEAVKLARQWWTERETRS